jgi:hypothetical protein
MYLTSSLVPRRALDCRSSERGSNFKVHSLYALRTVAGRLSFAETSKSNRLPCVLWKLNKTVIEVARNDRTNCRPQWNDYALPLLATYIPIK